MKNRHLRQLARINRHARTCDAWLTPRYGATPIAIALLALVVSIVR